MAKDPHITEMNMAVRAEFKRLLKEIETHARSLIDFTQPAARAMPRSAVQLALYASCVSLVKSAPRGLVDIFLESGWCTKEEQLFLRQLITAPSVLKEDVDKLFDGDVKREDDGLPVN